MSHPSETSYQHLGPFSGLVQFASHEGSLFPVPPSSAETRRRAHDVLRFHGDDPNRALDVHVEGRWIADDIEGEKATWSVGFGPRTHAWILKPRGARERLPGVLALHDHGHFKFYGKEKIADGPNGETTDLVEFRSTYYGGRAFANRLARRGFVVLVHDVFLWGSRRFPIETFPDEYRVLADAVATVLAQKNVETEVAHYNGGAYLHEHLVSKYCTLLDTSFAAIVAYEDRCALQYLRSRSDVDPNRAGCLGLSGGGARAVLLRATSADLAACGIAGMMSTYQGLLDHCVASHTWMFFPAGWSKQGDWPDLASCGAPAPLLVQYLLDDEQFTPEGMRGANSRIKSVYDAAGAAESYVGEFYPGPHRFDVEMQERAFEWFVRNL